MLLKKLAFQNVCIVQYLPSQLDSIFNVEKNKYLYAGTFSDKLKYGNLNVSLFISVLICLKHDFISLNLLQQQKILEVFIEKIKTESKLFKYTNPNFNKNDVVASLNSGFVGTNIIKFFAEYLCVNIFVVDINEDKLMYGNGNIFVPHKKSIFLKTSPYRFLLKSIF